MVATTKLDMVRAAITRGKRDNAEIVAWIKKEFREEIAESYVASIKSRLNRTAEPAEPDNGDAVKLDAILQLEVQVRRVGLPTAKQLLAFMEKFHV